MKKRMDKRIKTIFKHYGFDNQAQKTIEEASELITAIVKFLKSGSYDDFQHLTEEVVDVEIMLEQLKLEILSTKEGKVQYEKIREHKLTRQIDRIEAEK